MNFVQPQENDDPRFIELVSAILNNSLRAHQPKELWITQIDKWFDDKWLYFSGKTLGAMGIWKRQMTIPPFVPERVSGERHLIRDISLPAIYVPAPARPLHIHQTSAENFQRNISQLTSSGLLVWFSGATAESDHGSVMVYGIQGEEESAWYASFSRSPGWKLERTRGLPRTIVTDLLTHRQAA